MFTPSTPATSMSPAPAAGAGAMHWLSTVSYKMLLMFVMQIFEVDENTREDIFESEDFKASIIDGVKMNKRAKLLFRGLRGALILGFNSYPPKAYEITLPLINVEWQQSIRKRRSAVDSATNSNSDSVKRRKESKGALTGPLFAYVNCMFNGGCGVVEDIEQHTIGIYSPRTRCTFTLPPIPGLRTGIPPQCRCVSLNGRLYVLGGLIPVDLDFHVSSELCFLVSARVKFIASSEVYVMDLRGGEWQWTTLPNMHDARRGFGVGVCNEKIFVFGGEFEPGLWSERCEVFDPEVNTWYRIRSMRRPLRICHNVATIGEKLFLHAGVVLRPQLFEHPGVVLTPQLRRVAEVHELLEVEFARDTEVPDPLEDEDAIVHNPAAAVYNPLQGADEDADVYDPLRNEWSVAEYWLDSDMDAVFVSDGRLLAMSENGIYQSFVDGWEEFTEFGPTMNISRICSYATEALDGIHGGLVTLAHCKDEEHGCGNGILQSSEFSEQLEVHWELITFNPCPANRCLAAGFNPFFCRIVL